MTKETFLAEMKRWNGVDLGNNYTLWHQRGKKDKGQRWLLQNTLTDERQYGATLDDLLDVNVGDKTVREIIEDADREDMFVIHLD